MCTMLVQTVAAPPLSRIAKQSVRMRNRMLLLGLAPMVAANAVFATATTGLGARHARCRSAVCAGCGRRQTPGDCVDTVVPCLTSADGASGSLDVVLPTWLGMAQGALRGVLQGQVLHLSSQARCQGVLWRCRHGGGCAPHRPAHGGHTRRDAGHDELRHPSHHGAGPGPDIWHSLVLHRPRAW